MAYLLRRFIFEDRWESQLYEMIDFHKTSGVSEVLFLRQSHQILMVPYPLDKHRRVASIYTQMPSVLRDNGIEVGVNIASIVGHSDADVPSNFKLPFQKNVDDELKEAHAFNCILDAKWQEYALEVCRVYAETVKPKRLFIDDDFRPTNHRRCMGCFCAMRAEKVSDFYNKLIDSAELLAHIKGNTSNDFEIRRIWHIVHSDSEIAIASRIRDEVALVSPRTQLGLMANGEDGYSVYGANADNYLRAIELVRKYGNYN